MLCSCSTAALLVGASRAGILGVELLGTKTGWSYGGFVRGESRRQAKGWTVSAKARHVQIVVLIATVQANSGDHTKELTSIGHDWAAQCRCNLNTEYQQGRKVWLH